MFYLQLICQFLEVSDSAFLNLVSLKVAAIDRLLAFPSKFTYRKLISNVMGFGGGVLGRYVRRVEPS